MSTPVERHYVVFRSPGTLFAEPTEREIPEWDPRKAMAIAPEIVERHGARPYGFRFVTRLIADPIPDGLGGTLDVEPKTIRKSPFYFIGGRLLTLEDVERDMPNERVLIANMRGNGYPRVIQGPTIGPRNYQWTYPFTDDDKSVDADGTVVIG